MDSNLRLRNLMIMALADGSLGEREVNFVTDRCAEMGLGEDELSEAIRYALDDKGRVQLPSDPCEGEALLADLIKMMAADGKLTEGEKRLFAICAVKLGYNTAEVDSMVDRLLRK